MHGTLTKRKVLLVIVASQLVAALVAITINVATGVIPASWHPYLWISWPVLGALVVAGIMLAAALSREGGGAAGPVSAQRAEYSHRSMLGAVRKIWIDGVLAHTVHRQVMIELGMEYRPDMLRDPWDLLLERPGQEPSPLAPGTVVTDVMQQHRGLLILGAPGAGKTTVLLGVLEQLLTDAAQDPVAPMPVVFPLATWAATSRPLAEWLVNELSGPLYGVARPVAAYWIAEERVLPLLDGLDEVALDKRLDCARAIDAYHAEHRLIPLVVSSRMADYDSLGLKLALGAALLIQPLTRPQVEHYLDRWGEPLAGLRAAVRDDPSLWELLQTPFLLSVAVSTYEGLPAPDLGSADSPDRRRARLLSAFIDKTLSRKRPQTYQPQDAVRWLSYVARALGQRLQMLYYVDFADLSWLPPARRWTVVAAASLLAGILSGVATGLLMHLFFGAWYGLAVGLITGIVMFGLKMIFGVELPYQEMGWPERLRELVGIWGCGTLFAAMLLGLIGGLLGLTTGAIAGTALTTGTAIGSVAGALVALPLMTAAGAALSDRDIGRDYPTGTDLPDAIWLSCALAVTFGIPAAGILGAVYGPAGVLAGAVIALAAGYLYSGIALLGHWLSHIWLVRSGLVPRRQANFLNFAAQRMLMLKVGDGYMFAHRLLLEHFAQIEPTGRPDRYASGSLPAMDLRSDVLLARALDDARDGKTQFIRELTFVGTLLPAEQWAPAAMQLADIVAHASLVPPRPSAVLDEDQVKQERLRAAGLILRLVMSAEHAEFSPAAAFRLGELITTHTSWDSLTAAAASYAPILSREEVLAAYQMAADSGHPGYAERAATRLAQLRTL